MEFGKMVMMTLNEDRKRDTDVKNRLLDSVGEGKGGMIWNMYITICEIDHQSKFNAWKQGTQSQCTGMTLSDGMGREGGSGCGTYVYPWLIHVNVWQKPLQYYKVISLQLK